MIGRLEEIILSGRSSEMKALMRNVVKSIKVHSISYIQPYYRIPSVRVMSGSAPRRS